MKLVAYLRDSGGREQEYSTLQQKAEILGWAKQNNYIITRIFEDKARPGSSTAGRDAFEEMVDYLRYCLLMVTKNGGLMVNCIEKMVLQ